MESITYHKSLDHNYYYPNWILSSELQDKPFMEIYLES